MPNRCCLCITDYKEIYPSIDGKSFEASRNVACVGNNFVPLIWFSMFKAEDLIEAKFESNIQETGDLVEVKAPLALKNKVLDTMQENRNFFNNLFEKNGGLEHHFDLFQNYLREFSGNYVTIEMDEISWLYPKEYFYQQYKDCLNSIERRSSKCFNFIVESSTVIIDRRFVRLEEARNDYIQQEDIWNYFRIMGDRYLKNVPWS